MKRFLVIVAAVLLALSLAGVAESQCVGGVCPVPQWRASDEAPPLVNVATTSHRQAVCRIYVNDGRGVKSIGSGVLIRYLGRFIVLTARHVIKDRRGPIHVRFGRRPYRWHQAKVLCEDATWDCAALEVSEPDGIKPAELAWGPAATPQPGDISESCGFGRRDTLRANRGRFIKRYQPKNYHGSAADWISLTGISRDGDSGGPVFDSAGRVVGVLWGASDRIGGTMATQGGRLHVMLAKAFKQTALRRPPRIGGRILPLVPIIRPIQPRQTDPPPMPPQTIVQTDPSIAPALQGIGSDVARIEENTRPPVEEVDEPGKMSPLLAGLVVLGSVVVGFVLFFKTQEG